MDNDLIQQLLQGEIFWYETTTATATTSTAFVPYPTTKSGFERGVISGGNLNKRIIEFLQKSWSTTDITPSSTNEKDKCFRHMMNERTRREKQKRSYFALHSMLPHCTKNDKNSIVETATKRVRELEWLKKDLERRNRELQENLGENCREENKIRVKIENPKSGIDSMLEALKCLKELDSKPRMIQSNFSNQQFLAVIGFETQMGAVKVEKAVSRRLQEAERKVGECWTDHILIHNNKV
ncbi:hypothetical protein GQ457_12G004220 [Hibiscus cannabinus]